MIFTRPWCAGEITTAVINDIRIVLVACDDYKPPDEQFLSTLDDIWSEDQKCVIGQYGIMIPMVRKAFLHVLALVPLIVKRFERFGEQADMFEQVLSECKLSTFRAASVRSLRDLDGEEARVIVAASGWDAEMRCACDILAIMAQKEVGVVVSAVHSTHDVGQHLATAHSLVVLLSRGLLQDTRLSCRSGEPLMVNSSIPEVLFLVVLGAS